MKSTIIEGLSVDEFKNIITDAVGTMLKQHISRHEEQTRYLTREETKDLLRISMPTLNDYTKKGILKGYRLGGRVLYNEQEIVASLREITSIKYKRIANQD